MNQFELKLDQWLTEVSDGCHNLASRNPEYPDFYVFQSSVIPQPELMIIAANPGGFLSYSDWVAKNGRRNKHNLGYDTNQYLEHPEWKISKPLLKMFEEQQMKSIFRNAVIMNAVYFNTKKVADLNKHKDDVKEMIRFCSKKSAELIYDIVKPKNILFLGNDAPKWLGVNFMGINDTVLRGDKDISIIQHKSVNNIPHYKIHHTSMNFSFNSGRNLQLKKEFFEKVFIGNGKSA